MTSALKTACGLSVGLFLLLAPCAQAAAAEEEKEKSLSPANGLSRVFKPADVDEPIPETYEPLNSTYVREGEELNKPVEESWQLKKEAKEQERAAQQADQSQAPSAERQQLEQRIQEPGAGAPGQIPPKVESAPDSLQIRGPQ